MKYFYSHYLKQPILHLGDQLKLSKFGTQFLIIVISLAFIFTFCSTLDAVTPIPVPQPKAIYHAFDMKFEEIIPKLASLRKAGFDYIQISPCQESRETLPHKVIYDEILRELTKKFGRLEEIPSDYLDENKRPVKNVQGKKLENIWWLAYQPISYKIGNQYGTEGDLRKLINAAKKQNIKIIADVVFNHVAGLDEVGENEWITSINRKKTGDESLFTSYMSQLIRRHPEFTKADFNPFKTTKYDYDGNLFGIWLSGALPSLNLKSEKVKKTQLDYLNRLIALGIEGFRFDAIKYFPPEIWQNFADFLHKQGKFLYGELVETWSNPSNSNPYLSYTKSAPTTDFVLFKALTEVFKYGGDLTSLRVPRTNGDPRSVTFSENHDTKEEQIRLRIPDLVDRKLATYFILARSEGVPLILADEFEAFTPELEAAIAFRKLMIKHDAPTEYVLATEQVTNASSKEVMIMLRGSQGFMILNKSDDVLQLTIDFQSAPHKLNGIYLQLNGYNNSKKTIENYKLKLTIPARNASFFVLQKNGSKK